MYLTKGQKDYNIKMLFKKIKSFIPIKYKSQVKNYLKYLKTRSLKEFDSKASYKAHNSEYEEKNSYQRVVEIHNLKSLHTEMKDGIWNNLYDSEESVGYFLDENKKIKNLIDIGSGTGWFVNYVALNYSNINSIYAIEPSSAAIKISQQINGENSKISYINGFSDIELRKLQRDKYIVTTFAVFQHLNILYTKKVLKELDKILKKDSTLYLSEPIANSRFDTFRLHYPRTKNFWKRNLKNYEVKFYNKNLIIARKK